MNGLFSRFSILLLSAGFGLIQARADVKMPMLFGDHMVLQQDSKIAVYGSADAGESVEVNFAGQNVKTAAGPDRNGLFILSR